MSIGNSAGKEEFYFLDKLTREQLRESLVYVAPNRSASARSKGRILCVLGDLVTPEFRSRKHGVGPEFPLALDVLDQQLVAMGAVTVDFAFLPDFQTRNLLLRNRKPMATIGAGGKMPMPVRDARVLGLSMMNLIQMYEMFLFLELAGIPILRRNRTPEDPLVVLGGPVWLNHEPLHDFADVIVLGDGESAMRNIVAALNHPGSRRRNTMDALNRIDNVYVPGKSSRNRHVQPGCVKEDCSAGGGNIVRGGVGAVMLSRGCPHACAFCRSSRAGGPYRVTPYPVAKDYICGLHRAGATHVMLASAAVSHYRSRGAGVLDIVQQIRRLGMRVRVMSDRPEDFDPRLLQDYEPGSRKLILAPESSPRIRRRVFLKSLNDNAILTAVDRALTAGVQRVQLYTILGVPAASPGVAAHLPRGYGGERHEDVQYIAKLAEEIAGRMRRAGADSQRVRAPVKIDCMPLIPSPGTALENLAFTPYSIYEQRIHLLRSFISIELRGMIEVSPAMDRTTHALQWLLERGTSKSGSILYSLYQQNPLAPPPADAIWDAVDQVPGLSAELSCERRSASLLKKQSI